MDNNLQFTTGHQSSLLISFSEPYLNVRSINGYTASVVDKNGRSMDSGYALEFRWGTDGVTYGDWKIADYDKFNAINTILQEDKPFFIELKLTQCGTERVSLESFELEYETADGIVKAFPVGCNTCDGRCDSQQLIFSNNPRNAFNPYAVGSAYNLYYQLSSVISGMFGFCVHYYKTADDQRSKDVILKEYSLERVIATGDVKILIPNNEFPTRELQYNPLMINYPATFEVQIVKSAFRNIFGATARPEVHDYLYFEQYLNMMYEVDAVAEPDDIILESAYWRVSLTMFQKRTAVIPADEEIANETNTLILNYDTELKEESEEEYKDVRNDDQTKISVPYKKYNFDHPCNEDHLRSMRKTLAVKEETIFSDFNLVSRYHYDLSSIPTGEFALAYMNRNNMKGDIAMSFWIRPHKDLGDRVTFFQMGDVTFDISKDKFYVNESSLDFKIDVNANKWYGVILNINDTTKDIALYVYELLKGTNPKMCGRDSKLIMPQSGSCVTSPEFARLRETIELDNKWILLGCPIDITNIRVWNTPLQQEEHKMKLVQNLVRDVHLNELADNAQPQLVVYKASYPR